MALNNIFDPTGSDPTDLVSILFPRDERGNPAAVLFALVDNPEGSGGKFAPVKANPDGSLVTTPGARTPVFVWMHEALTASDVETTPPASRSTKAYDATGCTKLIIDIDIVTPGSYVKLKPYTWNELIGKYVGGDPSDKIEEAFKLILEVNGEDDVYLMPFEIFGDVRIAVAGV